MTSLPNGDVTHLVHYKPCSNKCNWTHHVIAHYDQIWQQYISWLETTQDETFLPTLQLTAHPINTSENRMRDQNNFSPQVMTKVSNREAHWNRHVAIHC